MSKELLKSIRVAMAKIMLSLNEQTLPDGTVILFEGDQIVEGDALQTYDADGNPIPLNDGEYTLEDGTKITVEKGVVKTLEQVAPDAETELKKKENSPVNADENAGVALDGIPNEAVPPVGEGNSDETIDAQLMKLIQQLTKKLAEMQSELKTVKASQTQMSSDFDKVKTTLAAQPLQHEVSLNLTSKEKQTRAERILAAGKE